MKKLLVLLLIAGIALSAFAGAGKDSTAGAKPNKDNIKGGLCLYWQYQR
jgi:hypothetical protein